MTSTDSVVIESLLATDDLSKIEKNEDENLQDSNNQNSNTRILNVK